MSQLNPRLHHLLQSGLVIPACPLVLTRSRKLNERRQRALCRYYFAAGAGGLAVGVHTTQFAIHDSKIGLYEPVLELVAEEFARLTKGHLESGPFVRIAGVCGKTSQALAEARLARDLNY